MSNYFRTWEYKEGDKWGLVRGEKPEITVLAKPSDTKRTSFEYLVLQRKDYNYRHEESLV